MKILYQFNWRRQLLLLLPLLFILIYESIGQSSSHGNTHINSRGEMTVVNEPHSFMTGVSSGLITTSRTIFAILSII